VSSLWLIFGEQVCEIGVLDQSHLINGVLGKVLKIPLSLSDPPRSLMSIGRRAYFDVSDLLETFDV
jgi:hypothetical protein